MEVKKVKDDIMFNCSYLDGIVIVRAEDEIIYSENIGLEDCWIAEAIWDVVVSDYIEDLRLGVLARELFDE